MYMQNKSARGIAACEILPKQRGALPGRVGMYLDGGDLFRYTTEKRRRNSRWDLSRAGTLGVIISSAILVVESETGA